MPPHSTTVSSSGKPFRCIPLTKGQFAIVDAEDWERLLRFRWYFAQGYAGGSRNARMARVVALLMGLQIDGLLVDHMNGDKLDNRRGNLRAVTRAQNRANRPAPSLGRFHFPAGVLPRLTRDEVLAVAGAFPPPPLPMPEYGPVPMTKGKFAVVSEIDFDVVIQMEWAYQSGGYATSGAGGRLLMHRFVAERMGLDLRPGVEVDHINGDKLDNRRENLRLATRSQNIINSGPRCDNTSGYKGVTFFRQTGRWKAQIGHNKRNVSLGYFDTPEEAAVAYAKAAKEFYGEFARC